MRGDSDLPPHAVHSALGFRREFSVFDRVTIVGVGLLGASLGLALKEHGLARRIVGVGRRGSASLDIALNRGAIDEASHEVSAVVKGSDLVVLCTPIRQFPGMLKDLASVLSHGIITDVGSTKAEVMKWAAEILPVDGPVFIGSHPMAGSEKRGPDHARSDLYRDSLCFLCTDSGFAGRGAATPAAASPPPTPAMDRTLVALEKVQNLWRMLGMRTLWIPALEHDRWVATISHLPHAVAFALVNAAAREPAMLQAVAGGFIDTTRVASSDTEMWTDIFLTNRDAIVQAIDTFSADLAGLKQAIATGDVPAIRAVLAAARKTRDELVEQRRRGNRGGE